MNRYWFDFHEKFVLETQNEKQIKNKLINFHPLGDMEASEWY